jgi:lipopolysaccharide/colanic/teichoic acid biosynthesis glycosyltransferase
MYAKTFKRIIDLTVATVALIALSPLLLLTAIALVITNGENPFFVQKRPGRNEKVFAMLKFRTMNNHKDANGQLLTDNERITRLGSLLRKTSIDELPQLWNVVRGDMTFVGPRPLLIDYLPLYNNVQRRRHEVRPGITGLAQVSGRNAISWEQKFQWDVWYVDHVSFCLDIKIIAKTIKKVAKKENINANENMTMGRFEGS